MNAAINSIKSCCLSFGILFNLFKVRKVGLLLLTFLFFGLMTSQAQCPDHTTNVCDGQRTTVDVDTLPFCDEGGATIEGDIFQQLDCEDTNGFNCYEFKFIRQPNSATESFTFDVGQGQGCTGELDASYFVYDGVSCQQLSTGGSQTNITFPFPDGIDEIFLYLCINSNAQVTMCDVCRERPPCTIDVACQPLSDITGNYCEGDPCNIPAPTTTISDVFLQNEVCDFDVIMESTDSGETDCIDANNNDQLDIIRTYTLKYFDVGINDFIVIQTCDQNIILSEENCCVPAANCNLQDINDEGCDIPTAFTDPVDVFSGIEACGAAVTMNHTDVGDTDVCGDGTGANFVRTYILYFDGQAFETCEQNITITDTTDPTFDNQNCGASDASASAYDDGWQSGDNDGSGFQAWNLNTNAGSSSNGGFFVSSSTNNGDGDSNADGDIDSSGRALGIYANSGSSSIANRQLLSPMILGSVLEVEVDNGFINSGGTVEFRLVTDINSTLWEFGFVSGATNYNIRSFNGTSVVINDSGIPFSDEGIKIEIIQLELGSINPIITDLGSGTVYDLGVSELIVPTGEQPIIQGFRYINGNAGGGSTNDVFINNMEICHPEVPTELTLECDDAIPTAVAPPVSDNCDSNPNVSLDESTQQGDCNTNTVITRTWTATDACGNSSQFVQTINILPDTQAPVLDEPSAIGDISCNDPLPDQETLTATDNCSSVTVTPSIDSYTEDVCNGYSITYRWTATDACNNSSEKTVTFNVLPDSQAPVLTDPAPLADITCSDALPAQQTLTATDDCSAVTVTPSVDPFTPDVCNGYAITYRWTATDACNNSSEKTVTFNVLPDSQAPVITDPAPLADISCSDALPAQETLNATDNCSAVTVTPSVDPFTPDVCNGYAITYRWTATDACNNSSEKTITFNVLPDSQAPVLNDPSPLADISCSDALPAQETLTATDNCSAVTVTPSVDPFTPDVCNGYAITYRWTATDACNNSSEKTVTFNVLPDTLAPVLNDPSPLADISCSDALPAQQTLTATDNCSAVTVTPSVDPFTPDVCNGYAITYRWTATDACNNSSEKTVTFNVLPDSQAPVLTDPAPLADISCSDALPAQETLTATDDCSSVTVTPSVDPFTPDVCNGYTITYRWTATDTCNNSSEKTVTFNVLPDSQAPVLTDPAPLGDISCSDALPAQETLTATDDCSAVTVTPSVDPFTPDVCNGYAITYRWTATDACNNSSEKTVTFNVLPDTQVPVLTDPAPLADISCSEALPAQQTLTATDDCSAVTVIPSVDPFTPDVCNGYAITYRWTATDACNNSSEKTVTFNVLPDTQAPVLTDPAPLADISCSDALPAQETLTATDNCSSVTVTPSVDPFTPDVCNGYAITYRWTAIDACNNSSEKTVTFNVLPDTQAPVITCPADALNLEAGPNLDTSPGALGSATATDNCSGVVSITFSDSDGDTNCSGTAIIRTWTATDACGNSSSCDQLITTGDDTPPEITCPPNVDLECVEGLDTSPAAQGTATATDSNDPNPVVTFNDVVTDGDCAGDYVITRTWTATDKQHDLIELIAAFIMFGFLVIPNTNRITFIKCKLGLMCY